MGAGRIYCLLFVLPGSFSCSENLFKKRTENVYHGLGRLEATTRISFSEEGKKYNVKCVIIAGF